MKIGDKVNIYNIGIDGKGFLEGKAKILKIRKRFSNRYFCKVKFLENGDIVERFINEYDII